MFYKANFTDTIIEMDWNIQILCWSENNDQFVVLDYVAMSFITDVLKIIPTDNCIF